MQASAGDGERSGNPRRFGIHIPGFIRAPLTVLLEQAGVFGPRSVSRGTQGLVVNRNSRHRAPRAAVQVGEEEEEEVDVVEEEEVSIRIIGAGEHEDERTSVDEANVNGGSGSGNAAPSTGNEGRREDEFDDGDDDFDPGSGAVSNSGDSSYQRYDIQHLARWFEQVLPFSLLLLLVFIRQHFQGFSSFFSYSSCYLCDFVCSKITIVGNLVLHLVIEFFHVMRRKYKSQLSLSDKNMSWPQDFQLQFGSQLSCSSPTIS